MGKYTLTANMSAGEPGRMRFWSKETTGEFGSPAEALAAAKEFCDSVRDGCDACAIAKLAEGTDEQIRESEKCAWFHCQEELDRREMAAQTTRPIELSPLEFDMMRSRGIEDRS